MHVPHTHTYRSFDQHKEDSMITSDICLLFDSAGPSCYAAIMARGEIARVRLELAHSQWSLLVPSGDICCAALLVGANESAQGRSDLPAACPAKQWTPRPTDQQPVADRCGQPSSIPSNDRPTARPKCPIACTLDTCCRRHCDWPLVAERYRRHCDWPLWPLIGRLSNPTAVQ